MVHMMMMAGMQKLQLLVILPAGSLLSRRYHLNTHLPLSFHYSPVYQCLKTTLTLFLILCSVYQCLSTQLPLFLKNYSVDFVLQIKQFMISATAKDSSIMIALQPLTKG